MLTALHISCVTLDDLLNLSDPQCLLFKVKVLLSTSQDCSEFSVLAASVAMVVGGIDCSKYPFSLLQLSCELLGGQGSVLILFVSVVWPSISYCFKFLLNGTELK